MLRMCIFVCGSSSTLMSSRRVPNVFIVFIAFWFFLLFFLSSSCLQAWTQSTRESTQCPERHLPINIYIYLQPLKSFQSVLSAFRMNISKFIICECMVMNRVMCCVCISNRTQFHIKVIKIVSSLLSLPCSKSNLVCRKFPNEFVRAIINEF